MKTAQEHFAVKGKNIMTPIILRYQMIGNYAVELSEGEGIKHDKIWGVTVLDTKTGEFDSSRCDCFFSKERAERHIWELCKEEQVK